MQKIPTVFLRDKKNPKRVTEEPDPDCLWVLADEGVPTEKLDGTCCAVIGERFYRRHVHKANNGAPPPGWIHWSRDPEQQSGHGWLPVSTANPADRWHMEAWIIPLAGGTYELLGPKVQGNPYHLERHVLSLHGRNILPDCERSYLGISAWLEKAVPMEGIVWHHPGGRMAKIKRRDFGLPWPVKP